MFHTLAHNESTRAALAGETRSLSSTNINPAEKVTIADTISSLIPIHRMLISKSREFFDTTSPRSLALL